MQQRNDETPFIVVHGDGSLGSADCDQVFGPGLVEDPQPHEIEPQPPQPSLEDALDAEIDKEPAEQKRAQPTQKTLHQVLRPKAKKAKQASFDFQKALQGSGGPRSDRSSRERVARAGLMVEETAEAVWIVDLGEPSSTVSGSFWEVVSGEEWAGMCRYVTWPVFSAGGVSYKGQLIAMM